MMDGSHTAQFVKRGWVRRRIFRETKRLAPYFGEFHARLGVYIYVYICIYMCVCVYMS